MVKKTTQIQISAETWVALNKRKGFPNESFDDLLKRIMLECPEIKSGGKDE